MNKDLLVSYLINFLFVIIRAATYAVSAFFAWRLFDILDKTDIRKEITENHNIGWAIMMAAIFGGLAFIIGQM